MRCECVNLHSSMHYIIICPSALPRPTVSISPASGSPTAGQNYSLTCSAEVVPHLVVEPSIAWTRQDAVQVNTFLGSHLQLHFNPLRTSDGGHYTCIANVYIPNVALRVTEADSRNLFIASKCICNCY